MAKTSSIASLAALGVAGVDHDRQVELAGDLDLGGEGAALVGGVGAVAVVVEPGLADRPHLLVGAERGRSRPPPPSSNPVASFGWRPTAAKTASSRSAAAIAAALVSASEADGEHPPDTRRRAPPRPARPRDRRRARGGCGSRSPAPLSLSRRYRISLGRDGRPCRLLPRDLHARPGRERPAIPVSIAELERRAVEAMEPKAANYVGAGAGGEDTIARQRRGLRSPPDRAADAARRLRARPLDLAARDGDAGAADAGADRRAEGRPRRGRAGDGTRRRRGRGADDRQHRLALHPGGDRRGRRRGRAALVPALLGHRPQAGRELRRPRRARPATARSSSPSTPSSPAGSRATCSRPGCRSSKAPATPTTCRTRSSAKASRRRPRRISAPPPATTSACSPTPL